MLDTFNFDLEKEQEIKIEDVLKEQSLPLELLADLVAEKLLTDDKYREYRDEPVTDLYKEGVMEETAADIENFSNFTITDEALTIYKTFTSIFPNSAGALGVELTWEEIADAVSEFADTNNEAKSDDQAGIAIDTYLYSPKVNEYGEAIIVIDVTNNGNETISLNQHDFILEHLAHEGTPIYQSYQPEEKTIKAGESELFISYYNVEQLLYAEMPLQLKADDFSILYTGDLDEVAAKLSLAAKIPKQLEKDVQQAIENVDHEVEGAG